MTHAQLTPASRQVSSCFFSHLLLCINGGDVLCLVNGEHVSFGRADRADVYTSEAAFSFFSWSLQRFMVGSVHPLPIHVSFFSFPTISLTPRSDT